MNVDDDDGNDETVVCVLCGFEKRYHNEDGSAHLMGSEDPCVFAATHEDAVHVLAQWLANIECEKGFWVTGGSSPSATVPDSGATASYLRVAPNSSHPFLYNGRCEACGRVATPDYPLIAIEPVMDGIGITADTRWKCRTGCLSGPHPFTELEAARVAAERRAVEAEREAQRLRSDYERVRLAASTLMGWYDGYHVVEEEADETEVTKEFEACVSALRAALAAVPRTGETADGD